jgi:hypothetical protein
MLQRKTSVVILQNGLGERAAWLRCSVSVRPGHPCDGLAWAAVWLALKCDHQPRRQLSSGAQHTLDHTCTPTTNVPTPAYTTQLLRHVLIGLTCVKHPRDSSPHSAAAEHVYPRPDQGISAPRHRTRNLDTRTCPAPQQLLHRAQWEQQCVIHLTRKQWPERSALHGRVLAH